jgi:hypothetical protein
MKCQAIQIMPARRASWQMITPSIAISDSVNPASVLFEFFVFIDL